MSVDIGRCMWLNDAEPNEKARSVLYVMSRDQRVEDNHALLAAQQSALESKLPLIVLFNFLPSTGSRSEEQYHFMLTGLAEVQLRLKDLNIPLAFTLGAASKEIPTFIKSVQPREVFFDFSPLKGPRSVHKKIAAECGVPCVVADTHNIIPVWVTSDKEEYAAHTIRNKIHKNLAQWLVEPPKVESHPHIYPDDIESVSVEDIKSQIDVKKSGVEHQFASGERASLKVLSEFMTSKLAKYGASRNEPSVDGTSDMSPYLHYGQVSALRIALSVIDVMTEPPFLFRYGKLASFEGEPSINDSADALLEEMVVRKELADNYCFYSSDYMSLSGAKDWAVTSLKAHAEDKREFLYSLEDLESCKTHDAAWNAAQAQMMQTGKMHGYMRMYWAKKILEWSPSAQEAINRAAYLNDFYSIDGGDPNGYVGIMWSIAGVHDRPWTEREIFGKIRYMNYAGLKRKFNIKEYEDRWLQTQLLK